MKLSSFREAKDLLSARATKQQVLRFDQDDKSGYDQG
jgi:hypothetical protein